MLALHQINPNRSSGHPLWLISNLSFSYDPRSLDLLHRLVSSQQGIELLVINDVGQDSSSYASDTWGVIPYFDVVDPEPQRLFFENVYNQRQAIMTLYIEEEVSRDQQSVEQTLSATTRIGKIIESGRLAKFNSGEAVHTYIRHKLSFYKVARDSTNVLPGKMNITESPRRATWESIEQDLTLLDSRGDCILKRGDYGLYLTKFDGLNTIPTVIGRLRARTFAEVGEGSEAEIDLDTFDGTYHQLFLVNYEDQKIVGGYRIGLCHELLKEYGISGLYSNQLYHIDDRISPLLAKSVELGRSFIIHSYQKKHMPLFLLWNGILHYIKSHKEVRYIFGMVSISRAFSDISRSLIISYLKQHHFNEELAGYFRPRQEFYSSSSEEKLNTVIRVLNGELIHLDEFISEIEPEHYRLPVLIRKYINQNAQFIGFNLDPDFSECVDGLMILNVDDIPVKTIQLLKKN